MPGPVLVLQSGLAGSYGLLSRFPRSFAWNWPLRCLIWPSQQALGEFCMNGVEAGKRAAKVAQVAAGDPCLRPQPRRQGQGIPGVCHCPERQRRRDADRGAPATAGQWRRSGWRFPAPRWQLWRRCPAPPGRSAPRRFAPRPPRATICWGSSSRVRCCIPPLQRPAAAQNRCRSVKMFAHHLL